MAEVNTQSAASPLGDRGRTDVQQDEDDDGRLSKDEMFHILQNERRRRVLEFISNCDGPVEMRDVAEQVAAWEHDTTVQALTSDERQRVYIALYQSHLPKLDDVGLIDYNQSRGIIDPRETVEQVEPYLNTAESASDGTSETPDRTSVLTARLVPFRAALLVGVVLVAAAWLGLPASFGIPDPAVATVIVVLFTLSGIETPGTR